MILSMGDLDKNGNAINFKTMNKIKKVRPYNFSKLRKKKKYKFIPTDTTKIIFPDWWLKE